MRKFPVILPIFFEDKESVELINLGIKPDVSLEEKETEDVWFYNIDNISAYRKHGKIYTEISSGGEFYLCPYSPEQVNELIQEIYD